MASDHLLSHAELRISRADEIDSLLQDTTRQLVSFIATADKERAAHQTGKSDLSGNTSLIHSSSLNLENLSSILASSITIAEDGGHARGFSLALEKILQYSVNPMAPGFLDKLYSAPSAPGIAADSILAVLNANVHVYQVSPVLTVIEKFVTKKLATLFGLHSPRAGGISVQGGSASNLTSIVVARNSLFPETKAQGNHVNGRQLVMFTSAHGHYSVEKAAQALGFGSSAVISVPTMSTGRMNVDALETLIVEAKADGKTPFYINATAGTTVLGSFDPFKEIARVAKHHRCWFHIDGAWGGSFIFSPRKDMQDKLEGCDLADSIAINPHKMMGVPLTCSLLLTRDLRLFQHAMTLKAGYLFHEAGDDDDDVLIQSDHLADSETTSSKDLPSNAANGTSISLYDLRDTDDPNWTEPVDLADMTMQCGRRGDSLKFFMSWQYYGSKGYATMVEGAYGVAVYMSTLVDSNKDLSLVLGSGTEPSCLQVCFYYTPRGHFVFGRESQPGTTQCTSRLTKAGIGKLNSKVTARISKALIPRGFMVDFAPALEGDEDKGAFLRVVVNISTLRETVERLIREVLLVGEVVVKGLEAKTG